MKITKAEIITGLLILAATIYLVNEFVTELAK